MGAITFTVVKDGDIEQCRDLCNELMALQKARAVMPPECFDFMNFDTRMKKSYEQALRSQVIVAKDGENPVGYVFSTIDDVEERSRGYYPDWAPVPAAGSPLGFYPDWVHLPQKIGCLNNLFLRDTYRGTGAGTQLFRMTMEWLESFPDCGLTFVYISNGNDAALRFYLAHGFTLSHEVFGGFITAAYKRK